MEYALIQNDTIVRTQGFDDPPPTLAPEKQMSWVPCTRVPQPSRWHIQQVTVTDQSVTFGWAPRDLTECKAEAVRDVKAQAGGRLSPSDWKVIRFNETGTPVDQITADFRSAIRAASNAHEAAINACQTVEELAALTFAWPEL